MAFWIFRLLLISLSYRAASCGFWGSACVGTESRTAELICRNTNDTLPGEQYEFHSSDVDIPINVSYLSENGNHARITLPANLHTQTIFCTVSINGSSLAPLRGYNIKLVDNQRSRSLLGDLDTIECYHHKGYTITFYCREMLDCGEGTYKWEFSNTTMSTYVVVQTYRRSSALVLGDPGDPDKLPADPGRYRCFCKPDESSVKLLDISLLSGRSGSRPTGRETPLCSYQLIVSTNTSGNSSGQSEINKETPPEEGCTCSDGWMVAFLVVVPCLVVVIFIIWFCKQRITTQRNSAKKTESDTPLQSVQAQ